jgi:hypothetical protein
LHLKWDHIDFERGLLLLPASKTGRKTIVLNAPALAILASNISWETDPVMASVDEALSASENRGANEGRTGKDDAADFLRAVLAAGAMPVLEIEQEARAAGLLGAESSISQSKAFRSARTLLGITSQRTGGTGATGKWVWQLYPSPKVPSGGLDALHFEGHLSGSTAS